MLSSQTKDPVTHQATMNLRTQLKGGLTLQALLDATIEEIDACICKVGFHNVKSGNLKKLAIRLTEEHNGDIPADLPSLLDLNGVGPKMSILYLNAIGMDAGIGVDVHVSPAFDFLSSLFIALTDCSFTIMIRYIE
jgi:endonuclease-3